jgi:hypothetical protein
MYKEEPRDGVSLTPSIVQQPLVKPDQEIM